MRTTILADDHLLLELKGLARQSGRSVTALIQEALGTYLKKQRRSCKISFAAIGQSSSGSSIARETDQFVRKSFRKREGF